MFAEIASAILLYLSFNVSAAIGSRLARKSHAISTEISSYASFSYLDCTSIDLLFHRVEKTRRRNFMNFQNLPNAQFSQIDMFDMFRSFAFQRRLN